MSTKSNPKLTIELVPSTCHFSNVRTTISSKEWDKIRFISYAAANNKCQICNDSGKNQGYNHNVECHEIWHYDDKNHIQKLVGLISLCPTCHQVKHIGRAIAIGKQSVCYAQLRKVNKWTQEQIDDHVNKSFEIYKERSKYEWKLDISLLEKEPYNLKLKKFTKRIFEIKKYKKKVKKSKSKKSTPKKAVIKRKTNRRPKKS